MNISQSERTFGNRSKMYYRDITKYYCGIGNLNCLLYYPLNLQFKKNYIILRRKPIFYDVTSC